MTTKSEPGSVVVSPLNRLLLHLFFSCNWMSAASVVVVVPSGECHEGKAGMVLFAGNTVRSMPERFVTLVQKGAI